MNQNSEITHTSKRMIASKPIFLLTILLFVLIMLSVWLSGLAIHRSIFKNALITTSTLSAICFLFFSFALFKGFKLKDNVGKITFKFKWEKFSNLSGWGFDGTGSGSGHSNGFLDGVFETVGAIIIGIIVILLLVVLLWLFGNMLWAFILFFTAGVYWIFFRAIRFVLRHRGKCKDNFWLSVGYGLGYTILYSFTFYFLILIPYFLGK